jgi:hypothetical protein
MSNEKDDTSGVVLALGIILCGFLDRIGWRLGGQLW